MLFNSYPFLLCFLPIFLLGFAALTRLAPRAVKFWFIAASLAFYAWWDPRYLLLLGGSIVFNFGTATAMLRFPKYKHPLLVLGVAANLAALVFFKYFDLFVQACNALVHSHVSALALVLPLGISFFTFTQLAFLVDVSRGEVSAISFPDFLLFVTYFPHLIAGPILHHKEMLPQFAAASRLRVKPVQFASGLAMLSIGLGKKVLIADTFAGYATPLFTYAAQGGAPKLFGAWCGALAYGLQLYFDFSGYCDMAVGLSTMVGIRLPANFNSPYQSVSLIEFWRRWHITLSRFLRDYLYIPLGGNRRGKLRRYLNLLLTMALGGLWHGANWTFLAWGTLHGVGLALNHAWRSVTGGSWRFPGKVGGWFLTMGITQIAWVLFRAPTFRSAWAVLKGMFGFAGVSLPLVFRHVDALLKGFLTRHGAVFSSGFLQPDGVSSPSPGSVAKFAIVFAISACLLAGPNSNELLENYSPVLESRPPGKRSLHLGWQWGIIAAILFLGCLQFLGQKSEFLYFQF